MNYKSIDYYTKTDGKIPYKEWYSGLNKFLGTKADVRLKRAEAGNYGYHRNLSGGITELKFVEGIRIYLAEVDNTIILLLSGGNKIRQNNDIAKAREYFKDYQLRNKQG